MAFIQCECGERIDLNQPANQVTCFGCGRTYTVPKLASAPVTNPPAQATPAPNSQATPLSATMVEDLPVLTQLNQPFGESIVAMPQHSTPVAAAVPLVAAVGNANEQRSQATPANQATPVAQSQIDTPAGGGMVTELGPGLRLLDRYEIQRKIGQGGMSTVYEAVDGVRGEKVALKVLLPNLAAQPALQERFLQEGRLSSNFSHPHIARVYDLHQTDTLIFLSMELLHGTTLRHDMNRRHDQRQVYRPTEVLAIVDDICDALEVVHAEGVVHRDLKPENFWLGLDGSVKVMDFGIARESSGTSFTNAGRGSGTPYYIAPEQLASSPTLDDRADQYSVGIILYELLTGELPQGAIVPPHEKNSAIPRKMSEAIFRALDAEPTNRFDSIGDFRTAVQFRTERTLWEKIAKPLAAVATLLVAGFVFLRWGAPLLEKKESPVWQSLGQQRIVENEELRFVARSKQCTIDSSALTFKLLSDAPLGATLDARTGEFVWTPTEAQGPQTYEFTIMAVAEEEGRAPVVRERSFAIEVAEHVDLPVFALPEPLQGKEHETLTYEIVASDPNLPAVGLRYEMPKLPPGMTIDHRDGTIRWTPNEQQGGKNYQLAVRVYLEGEAHLDKFTERTLTIQVVESIDPPAINAPAEVRGMIDEPSNLRVTVRDPNVPAIDDYFALKNGERIGMSIDPQSGEIFWTPTAEQAGTEQEVTVQVLWDEAGKTTLLSEKVMQVVVAADEAKQMDDAADDEGSLTDSPLNDDGGLAGGGFDGGFGGGFGGGGLGGGGLGGAGGVCKDDCNKPGSSLPGTGAAGGAVFGSEFPSSIGSNRPAGGGGSRPGGNGNAGGGNNLNQVVDLIQKIKQAKRKQQSSSNASSGQNSKPQQPSNKLPPGWQNKLPPNWQNKKGKLPTTGIRLEDLQKKRNSKDLPRNQASSSTRVTRDLPRQTGNLSKLPTQWKALQQRTSQQKALQQKSKYSNSGRRDLIHQQLQRSTSKQLPSQNRTSQANNRSRMQTWQRQLSQQKQSSNRLNSNRTQAPRNQLNRNGGNQRTKQTNQWDKLKKASNSWNKR